MFKKMRVYNYIWWLWELPQLWLGIIILFISKSKFNHKISNTTIFKTDMFSGVSLSRIIILRRDTDKSIRHEYGHCIQSRYLGPLYLIVIGLPSAIHNLISRKTDCNYYHFYTEKWADKLGKVKR